MVGDVPVQIGLVHAVDRDQEHVLDLIRGPAATALEDDTASGAAIANANERLPPSRISFPISMFAPFVGLDPLIRGSVWAAFKRFLTMR